MMTKPIASAIAVALARTLSAFAGRGRVDIVTGDNSTFTSSTGTWAPGGDAVLSVDTGRLMVTSGTTGNSARLAVPVIAGRTYEFRVKAFPGTGTSRFYAGSNPAFGSADYVAAVAGGNPDYVTTFVPAGAFVYVVLQTRSTIVAGETAFFDDFRIVLT